jgi:hypothetical protein
VAGRELLECPNDALNHPTSTQNAYLSSYLGVRLGGSLDMNRRDSVFVYSFFKGSQESGLVELR